MQRRPKVGNALGLVPHAPDEPRDSRAEERAGLTDRADAEQPDRPRCEVGAETFDELDRLGKPGLVVDRTADHRGVVSRHRHDLVDRQDVRLEARGVKPRADLLGDALRRIRTAVAYPTSTLMPSACVQCVSSGQRRRSRRPVATSAAGEVRVAAVAEGGHALDEVRRRGREGLEVALELERVGEVGLEAGG